MCNARNGMKPYRLYPAGSKNPEKEMLNELGRVVNGKSHIVDEASLGRENRLFADQRNFMKCKCRKWFYGIIRCATMASAKWGASIVTVLLFRGALSRSYISCRIRAN